MPSCFSPDTLSRDSTPQAMAGDSVATIPRPPSPSPRQEKEEVSQEAGVDEGTEKKRYTVKDTLVLAILSLGVIYGDIGTSTLYTLNGLFPASSPVPSSEDIVGGVSCILWALLLVPIVKYCFVALEFGTGHSEGGPFAIYTTLFPPAEEKHSGWRTLTTYAEATSPPGSSRKATKVLHRPAVKFALFVLVLLGVALTVADGMLTPAVSVTSAVAGIAVAFPSVTSSIVGISVALLAVLFIAQALGTKRIGVAFSPIIAVWFLLNGVGGAINIAKHPAIFRAFDPSRAVMLFVRTGNYDLLNGVILCITGCEAVFANLGQFSKGSIRLAFLSFATPCLMLQYLGQGASLIDNPETIIQNVFFQSIPGGVGSGFWWVTWIFAVLSAIIASQAMITATFSLVQQLTQLHVMPALKIVYTDDDSRGRIYVPMVNFLLFVGCIGLTCGFGTDVGLTAAYGFAISGVLCVTTLMIALAIPQIKGLPVFLGVVYFVFSGFIDGLFLGATSKKIPHGAWFPLGLACVLTILLLGWSWAKGLENTFDRLHRYRLSEVMRPISDEPEEQQEHEDEKGEGEIAEVGRTSGEGENGLRRRAPGLPGYEIRGGGAEVARPPVFALFHNHSSSAGEGAPHSFTAFLRSYPALPRIIIFLSIRTCGVPHVAPSDRYLVDKLRAFDGVFVATISFGFRDVVDLSDVAGPLSTRIIALESRSARNVEELNGTVRKVDQALHGAVTHIVPHFHVSADQSTNRNKLIRLIRTFLLEEVYRRVAVNFDPTDQFKFGSEEDVLRMGVTAVL